MNNKRKKIITSCCLLALLAAFAVVFVYFGKPLIEFVSDTEGFRKWVEDNAVLSRIGFVGMVVLQVIVAVIPGEPFEIAAGYAFGTLEGILLYTAGVIIGSLPIILLVRRYGRRVLLVFFDERQIDSLKFLHQTRRVTVVAFILMFIPGTPKDLLTYFLGLTDMTLPTFLLICRAARLPSIVTSVIGGSALGTKNYTAAIAVFAIAAVVSACGFVYWRYLEKKHNNDKK